MFFSVSYPVRMIVLILQFSNCPILCFADWHVLSFILSLVICWDHPGANWSLQSICLPLKLDCCGAESGCALLRLNRNTFGITLFQISIPHPHRRKRGSLSGESHVIPCPACGSLSLSFFSLPLFFLSLSLSFSHSLFLSFSHSLSHIYQNNADQVAFQVGGGLSALEQILQVVTAASTPTAVPRIPLKWVLSPNT